ncbi:reverse transcriptase domain-containing protein, partial [Tanacetum coccineum]
MLKSSIGIFSFQFSSMDGLDTMLENDPWFIRNNPLILKKWNSDVNLLKEDVGNVPFWVKLHGVLVTAFSEDGLSAVGTDLGTPLMLESKGKPPRNACCKFCGRDPGIVFRVGPKVVFKPVKQLSKTGCKKNNVNTSSNKKKYVEPTIEVSNSNLFDVLNSVENDVDLGTNGGLQIWLLKRPILVDSRSEMWNLIEVTLVDDEGKPLTKINSSGDHDSEDEVASVDNDMTNFLASKKVVPV